MVVEVVHHVAVGIEDRAHVLGVYLVFQPGGCHRDDTLRLELVAVQQVAHEGLGIVGLVGDVREDEHPGLGGIGLQGQSGRDAEP